MQTHTIAQDSNYIRKWSKKVVATRMLGGKCKKCGETNILVLEFHHTRDKIRGVLNDYDIRSRDSLNEIKKCELLCRRCHQERGRKGRPLKFKFLDLAGTTKCSVCGYRGVNPASLEFHHRPGEIKSFNVGNACRGNNLAIEVGELVKEIRKCCVLCSNCHTLEHFDNIRFQRLKKAIYDRADQFLSWRDYSRVDKKKVVQKFSEGLGVRQIALSMGVSAGSVSMILKQNGIAGRRPPLTSEMTCKVCGRKFLVKGMYAIQKRTCCSLDCARYLSANRNRPSAKVLVDLVKNLSKKVIAMRYGVDITTVYRWLKYYHLNWGS